MNINEVIEICKNNIQCQKCKLYDNATGDCLYIGIPRNWKPIDIVDENPKTPKKKRG